MKPGNGAADEAVSLAGESPAPALGQSPGSALDCRGGNESAESSSESPRVLRERCRAVRRASELEGRNIRECVPRRNASPREAACGTLWSSSPALPGEDRSRQGRTGQVHLTSRRRRGRSTPGKRNERKVGTVPVTSRGWRKRRDTTYKAEAEMGVRVPGSAHGLVVAGKGGNSSGAKEPWARTVGGERRGSNGMTKPFSVGHGPASMHRRPMEQTA